METKKYLRQWLPGSFFSEDSTKELDETKSAREQLSDRAFSYQTFERSFVKSGEEVLMGEPKNHSKKYYIGQEFTAKEAISHPDCNHIMKSNIEGNRWERMVRTKHGRWFNIDSKDIVESL